MTDLFPGVLKGCVLLLSSMLIASCASSDFSKPDPQAQRMVWPNPPEKPRIGFVKKISSARDLGIEPGLWSKLKNWIGGGKESGLVRPTDVLIASDGVLFVADPGYGAVHRFDQGKNKHDLIRPKGVAFRSPVALAAGADGRVYVSDSALNQIFVIDAGAKYAVPFQTAVEFDQPTGVSWDGERLYVVNTRKHEILALSPEGRLLARFGAHGIGAAEFNYPTMIWSDPARRSLWITDSLNFRIQQLDLDGRFLSTFGHSGDATGDLSRPKGVAVDGDGNIYVLDALFNSMQIFNSAGKLLLYIGEQGRGAGQFWLPSGIFIDDKNRIYVADSFNSRVQIFKYYEENR